MPSYAIIGGSRGIGLEFVRQLALNEENTVFVTVRNKDKSTHLRATVAQLPHKNVRILQADVVDKQAIKNAATELGRLSGGGLDILIYNAARLEFDNLLRGPGDYDNDEELDEEFIQSFKVNVLGPIHIVNNFLPLLRKGSAKKIIILGSEGGERSFVQHVHISGLGAYGVTKAAEHMVATKYAVALENEGFTVVSVSPGFVDVSGTNSEPLSEGDASKFNDLVVQHFAAFPNAGTLLTPEQAVKRLLLDINNIGPAESGTFRPYPEFDTNKR
ncbi:NAD-P-binding protein [Fomitopsis serialis]|uniref:NAD-P-binding protein n=1 Tax=Fomitopsis serialis TaxID=139415 RepID=UPI002008B04F|nr:NAD-P-binding protein [Neoantrodia serialis]KAH9922389.1 NAD-P-binding protein [Neoantrodia serialis]